MKTAVIYARYSSDNQTEQSIEGQLRVCKEYAERNNITILNTYIDRAMTGTNDNRPDFQKMIKDSAKKEWNYVLVYKLDRFSRNKYESVIHKKTLKDNGVKIISCMENIPDTPEGIILESLLEGMNQYFSAELSQKIRRGMKETRLKGYYQGGRLLYGYKLDGRKVVVDEDETEIVRYIYKKYISGLYVRQIIEDLTQRGIYRYGKPFVRSRVFEMLRNECYTGRYSKYGEEFNNIFPRIIDDETFSKARARSRVNKKGGQSFTTVYLLRNKLVCGYCGKPITSETGTSRKGKKVNYYKCSGRKLFHNGCIKETLRQEILENFILDTIITELSKPKNIDKIVKKLMEMQEEPTSNSELDILVKTKKQIEYSLENLVNAIEKGIMNRTTQSRMQDLENQKDEIDKRILIEKSKTRNKVTESDIRKYLADALKMQALYLIQTLIKQIKMYNDKIEITFNNVTNKSPNDEGSFLFSINKKMVKVIQNKVKPNMIVILVEFYI